jgi:hypothetical protein
VRHGGGRPPLLPGTHVRTPGCSPVHPSHAAGRIPLRCRRDAHSRARARPRGGCGPVKACAGRAAAQSCEHEDGAQRAYRRLRACREAGEWTLDCATAAASPRRQANGRAEPDPSWPRSSSRTAVLVGLRLHFALGGWLPYMAAVLPYKVARDSNVQLPVIRQLYCRASPGLAGCWPYGDRAARWRQGACRPARACRPATMRYDSCGGRHRVLVIDLVRLVRHMVRVTCSLHGARYVGRHMVDV